MKREPKGPNTARPIEVAGLDVLGIGVPKMPGKRDVRS